MLSNEFLPSIIIPKWERLINQVVSNNINFELLDASRPYMDNYKWLRLIIRFLRFKIGLKFIPSSIQLEDYCKKLYKMLWTYCRVWYKNPECAMLYAIATLAICIIFFIALYRAYRISIKQIDKTGNSGVCTA